MCSPIDLTKQAWDVVPGLTGTNHTLVVPVSLLMVTVSKTMLSQWLSARSYVQKLLPVPQVVPSSLSIQTVAMLSSLACMHSQLEQSVSGCTAGGSSCASATEAIGRQAGPVRQLTTGGTAAVSHRPTGPPGHQPTH